MATKEDLEKIAKEQGLEKPEGDPVIPKRPPKKRELPVDPEAEIKRLMKELKSAKSSAQSYKRYRDREKVEHEETMRELLDAQKDRDDAKDRVKELEKPSTTMHTIQIGAQTHYRTDKKDAIAHAKELLDADVWWITLGREE